MRVFRGIIGWSNWRPGTEFYEDTEAKGEGYARWLPRGRYSAGDAPRGRLLTDEMEDPEGADVLVIVCARMDDREEFAVLEGMVRAFLEETELPPEGTSQ